MLGPIKKKPARKGLRARTCPRQAYSVEVRKKGKLEKEWREDEGYLEVLPQHVPAGTERSSEMSLRTSDFRAWILPYDLPNKKNFLTAHPPLSTRYIFQELVFDC
jgi:hypothetical protein